MSDGQFLKGTIVAWYSSDDAPPGWAVCDGSQGTPDLRGRFIMGADDKSEIGILAGPDAEDPTHTHDFKSGDAYDHGHSYHAEGDEHPKATGLNHWHDGTTDKGSSIPPSVKIIFLMKL
jgi:hypothetical protein